MIDYQLQLRRFFKVVKSAKISSQAQTLYYNLLSFFDEVCYPTNLKIDNQSLYKSTRLSHEQLRLARLELQKLALINYTPGSGSASGSYTIFDLQQIELKQLCADCRELENSALPQTLSIDQFASKFDYLNEENKLYLHLICDTLKKALSGQQSGIFAGSYETARTFIIAKNELVQETIHKLIITLRSKPNITNKEAYILTVLQNEAKNIRINNKYKEVYQQALEKGFTKDRAEKLAISWLYNYKIKQM